MSGPANVIVTDEECIAVYTWPPHIAWIDLFWGSQQTTSAWTITETVWIHKLLS